MSRHLTGSLLIILAALGVAAPSAGATMVSANINVTQAFGTSQREGAIAINPANPKQMFTVAADAVNKDLITARSSDGGATWTRATVAYGNGTAPGSAGLPASCCNPSAAFDQFGNLYITYLGPAQWTYVIFAYSTDGGASFKGLTAVEPHGDQPTVATGNGSVWLTYNAGGVIKAAGAAVTGLGQVGPLTKWEVPGPSGNYGDVAVGPTGQVAVTYGPTGGSEGGSLYLNVKRDGLGPQPFTSALSATHTNVGGFDYIPAQPHWGIDPEAGLAWDHSGGPHNGRLYLVYVETPTPGSSETSVLVRHSEDEGATWSEPVQVNEPSIGTSHFMPRISVDQSTGHLGVTWWDTRNDPLNNSAQYFGAFSSDGGASFTANFQISAGTSNEAWAPNPPAPIKDQDLGDYTGNAFAAGRLWGLWADNSNSTGDNPNGAHNALNLYTAYAQGESPPPVVTVTLPAPNAHGWYTASPVAGTVTATEPAGGASIASITCAGAAVGTVTGIGTESASAPVTVASDGVTGVSCQAVSAAGATAESPPQPVKLDTLAPVLAPSLSPAATPIPLGAAVTARANASDPLSAGFASGIASESCGPVETAAVGASTLACSAADVAGNNASAPLSYVVGYAVSVASPSPGPVARGAVVLVRFQLTDAAGKPIPDATASAIKCSAHVAFATVARCPTYRKRTHTFQTQFKVPPKLAPGVRNMTITAVSGATTLASAIVTLQVQ